MAAEEADQLQGILERARSWPIWSSQAPSTLNKGTLGSQVGSYGKSTSDIELWVAMRESDRERIKALINWPSDRDYRVDPLPDRISLAFSDLLFGEDPTIEPAKDGDADNMDELIKDNQLPSELRRAAADCSSEGEIWWRIYSDPAQSDRPQLEFHSRLDVVPLYRGRKIVAAAFVSHIATQEIKLKNQLETMFWRHVEIQTDTLTRNLLYFGNFSSLGETRKLSSLPETADYPEEWNHGIKYMLAGRIVNKLGRDYRLGLSDYAGIRDLLLDLNEARSIMAENARLTAKSRMVVPLEAVRDGKFDAGQDVIVHETLDQAMGDGKPGPYAVLQYTFEAQALLAHIGDLTTTALTRSGLAEQFVQGSAAGEGSHAYSGTALRTRLIPTTLAAAGRGRRWDEAVPHILRCLALVDALPVNKLGFDHKWASADELPSFERSSVLPEDPMEETNRHVAAVGGEVESIEQAVDELHTDWTDDQKAEEVKRIKADRAGAGGPTNFNGNSNNPGDLPGGGPSPTPPPPGDQPPVDGALSEPGGPKPPAARRPKKR